MSFERWLRSKGECEFSDLMAKTDRSEPALQCEFSAMYKGREVLVYIFTDGLRTYADYECEWDDDGEAEAYDTHDICEAPTFPMGYDYDEYEADYQRLCRWRKKRDDSIEAFIQKAKEGGLESAIRGQ